MADQLITAIDIGSSKIATIVGLESKEDEQLRIIGFNSTPSRGVKKGLVVDIDKVTESVIESIEKAERMAGQKIHHTLVSVGGPHISSLNSRGVVAVADARGEISETDINRVVEAARAISLSTTRQIIEVSPRDFVVDGQEGIKNPIGMSGVRLEVETHIITASHTNLKNIDRCMDNVGVQNQGFIFAGLASSESVLTDTEKELGVVCVDIGGGKTDVALYVDGSLSYSSSIPIGAKHITNDIAVGLRVSLDSAEKIKLFLSKKLGHQTEKSKQKIDELDFHELLLPEQTEKIDVKVLIDGIIGPRLEEIFRLVSDEIVKSNFIEHIPSGLVITGGGALTVGILEMGRKVIGLPIRIGIPSGITGLVDEIIDPQFSTTVGLILQGRKNIMSNKEEGFKNFNKILKDFSIGGSVGKVKEFFKQFIP
ncbi:cell division protein FtsA [Candidatus Roizmanbacteria bacterium RIFOXYB2_FULL_38_10]|uniref:Cell division protein FtsA n=1 Tax=Candidatus Roizmanbacteria bacterium RIFOXYD1_FULL_38_12 TaxID=1802093 RepID=A0A1F7L0B8_9BACT|nr:MAG: cell division protein FtsA [Candidatus Roizmanbacteria bacterium RIFOXYA2_FULL_38_14]OGK63538.1 MAG: cell division protein FtsA [Candidatus Roizmanbacteria bacterium RIFOXYA1_FULL_37_12]OGK65384.1 MAG: cell division protein FtsA [Candidatus Roizmanbacteria bacterium RIFOXYB1_FULL_40_23]OGK67901.1 MAG: cell division protein FtsA [Candidatus Roizmanbacteria bacterium RIFOXYB2_FULL_38_10]OGK69789.1 MAG: cell division protein FtsA [Candidatus Roizmanbacteria bacterium RIFOXYC1_FULL_38_14]O